MILLWVLLLLFSAQPVWSHDSWISTGKFRNKTGEFCCGQNDCQKVTTRHVVVSSSPGVTVVETHEFVLETEVMPSQDGYSWRCQRPDKSLRCLFVPSPGY